MQNFNEQQLNLIKNSVIIFATWETYKEVFKYLYVNGGFGFQSEFFNKQKEYGYNLDLLQAGCFPFQEGLFVYIPNNGTAFVRSIDIEERQERQEWQRYYKNGNLLLTFDKKTFDEFSKIQDDLIQKEEQERLAKCRCEIKTEPTLFEKVKQFFGICKK
jgi:hypothetical protein